MAKVITASSFTVVLLYPDYLTDDYGQDIYVGHVMAKNEVVAVVVAQEEAFKASRKDGKRPENKEDFALLVVFGGRCQIKLYGWQM